MKQIIFSFVFLFIFFLKFEGQAQSLDVADKNLTWYSSQSLYKQSSQVNATWKIITNSRTGIDLVRGSEQTINIKIDNVEGTWIDELSDGKLIYSVHYQSDIFGRITIERKNGSASVLVDFTQGNPDAIYQEFFISKVE